MFSSCSGYGSGAFIAKRSGISTMVDRESFHDFPWRNCEDLLELDQFVVQCSDR